MKMSLKEAEAVGMLRGGNTKAWDIFIEYFYKKLEFERNQCEKLDDVDKLKVHQGKARAFREVSEIDREVENVFNSHRGDKQ